MNKLLQIISAVWLLTIGFAAMAQDDEWGEVINLSGEIEPEGLVIKQDEAPQKTTGGDDFLIQYLSADSALSEDNIEESNDLAFYREEYIMKSFEIKTGLTRLMEADKFDPFLARKISQNFDKLINFFKQFNEGNFDEEVGKLEFLWQDFQDIMRSTGEEQLDLLIESYSIWEEVNIDITQGFNRKFKSKQ